MGSWKTLEWKEGKLVFIDQTLLPGESRYVATDNYQEVATAIKRLQVRGAPAIGVAAAFGVALGARQMAREVGEADFAAGVRKVIAELAGTRPTAVNLFWALERQQRVLEENAHCSNERICALLEAEAAAIATDDAVICRKIGEYGASLLKDGMGILTHCNAGALATSAYGTALAAIRVAVEQGKKVHVFADETRPLLQGARLTAWELMEEGIPVTLITDNMAATVMRQGKVQAVIVGADRITSNGDVANKIGTYGVAILAREHRIPFYVAAPLSTIDLNLKTGDEIPIEERAPSEVTSFGGATIAPAGVAVFNPAFDVTPARLITAIITEKGIAIGDWESTFRKWKGQKESGV
ncbi:MAG: S-methyl-5-thioribose-1-phosphate isomerase [Firmicutes bacterium]|nr:S-methyl-5-thioribose-1-phosphate isomerase [Bacillota bacterium]